MTVLTEAQEQELESLVAIYGEGIVATSPSDSSSDQPILKVRLPIELGQETAVHLLRDVQSEKDAVDLKLRLSHLPPVLFELVLPAQYLRLPDSSPPSLRDVQLPPPTPYCPLPSLQQRLQVLLSRSYDESAGDPCLWTFLESVREAHFLDRSPTNEILLQPSSDVDVVGLSTDLSKWEAECLGKDFAETTFPCGICLESKKGRKCIEFGSCGHVFCRECVESCWSLAIREGDVLSISCPSVECIKSRTSHAPPLSTPADQDAIHRMVLDLLGQEAKDRWLWLQEKKRVDADPTYTVCPQLSCQAPVPAPPNTLLNDDDDGDGLRVPNGWDRFRECLKCGFSFCVFCGRVWHGPTSACVLSSIPAFIKRYYDLSPTDPERLQLEAKYGRKNLEKLAAKAREDDENRKWLEANSKACPGCQVTVEKSVGCNHMTCARCQAHFCFRCGSSLSPTDPYKHYNTEGRPCFQQLFDAEDVAAWAGGGVVWDAAAFR